MFIYFFFISDKKVWCYYNFTDAASLRNKTFIFWAKVSRTSHMNTLHVYSHVHVPAVTSCSNFSPVTTSWLFDTALFYYHYVNILNFFLAFLGVGIEIKILYFCTWEKHNVFMSDFPNPELLKVPLSCFMD